jgi:HSP20 family protein
MFGLMPWRKSTMAPLARTEHPFGWLPEEFAALFNRLGTTWPMMESAEWPYGWALTTENKEKEIVVRIELPGFTPEEVKVEVTGEVLLVEAEHKEPAEKPEEKTPKVYAHVKRMETLPPDVDAAKAEAVYRNGVLEIHLPRKPEAVGRRLEVKT